VAHDHSSHRILRRPTVIARTGLSDTTIWRMYRRGEFPRPVQLSANAVGWRESDVDAWLAQRQEVQSRG